MGNSLFFVELTALEVQSKLGKMGDKQVLFWIPLDQRSSQELCNEITIVVQYHADRHSFVLGEDIETSRFSTSNYLCRLVLGEVTYFSAGQWKNNEFQLTAVYRHEKRVQERLLTYPHRQVYMLLEDNKPLEAAAHSNIVAIHKSRDVLDVLYQQLNPQEAQGITRLRVLDLSTEGISFLVGQQERERLDFVNSKLSLEFDQQCYKISIRELLYEVNYLDIYSQHSSLLKIGAVYQGEQRLKDKLNFYLNEDSVIRFDVKHGFEDFILRRLT